MDAIKQNEMVLIVNSTVGTKTKLKKILQKITKKQKGIYLSLLKPKNQIKKELENSGIITKDLYFIDVFGEIEGPAFLTEISIAISNIFKNKKVGFLVVDSVETLFVYNGEELTERFLHYLIGKVRMFGATGLMVYSSDNKKELKRIQSFYDRVI